MPYVRQVLFLAGPHSRGITGTTLFVDAGYHIMGV
jgi:enoyl-[acyl-carrier-protein] reductase (NADH)